MLQNQGTKRCWISSWQHPGALRSPSWGQRCVWPRRWLSGGDSHLPQGRAVPRHRRAALLGRESAPRQGDPGERHRHRPFHVPSSQKLQRRCKCPTAYKGTRIGCARHELRVSDTKSCAHPGSVSQGLHRASSLLPGKCISPMEISITCSGAGDW